LSGFGVTATAAENGIFVQADANLALGAGHVTIPEKKLQTGGSGPNVYGLSNDGRFAFGGSIGYLHDNLGVRLRYASLGRQHVLSANGAPAQGGFSSSYLGLEGMYLIPLSPKKVDLMLMGGAGVMRTSMSFNGTTPTAGKRPLTATQNEPVLALGVGLRVTVAKNLTWASEVTRLTPVRSGVRQTSIYNTGATVISTGLAYSF
jgi:hypothetical protein